MKQHEGKSRTREKHVIKKVDRGVAQWVECLVCMFGALGSILITRQQHTPAIPAFRGQRQKDQEVK